MVKDHSDSERGNHCHLMGYSFRLTARFFFNMHHPIERITYITAFVEHWLEQEIAQWIHHVKTDLSSKENTMGGM